MNAGIDYGLGRTNVDVSNGIRYGVISMHDITQAWCDSSEPDYGEPTCPKCGRDVLTFDAFEGDSDEWPVYGWMRGGCADFVCVDCEHLLDSQDAFGEEVQSYNYSDDGYEATSCLDNDVMILKSPYYTFARYCSPCVPGAGNLNDHDADGAKTYCFGHDWFDDNKAPYPVYSVATGEIVQA